MVLYFLIVKTILFLDSSLLSWASHCSKSKEIDFLSEDSSSTFDDSLLALETIITLAGYLDYLEDYLARTLIFFMDFLKTFLCLFGEDSVFTGLF